MNKIGLNIAAVLLLSGCSMFNKNPRTDSKGETINKNAPVFISPKTNAPAVNKPNTNQNALNKPPQVIFNAENYVMVKEKDLNAIADQKTNEILLNIKKSNANAKQPNKELDAALDSHIKKSVQPSSVSLTPNVIQLAPAVEPEKLSNSAPIHPLFAFILVILSVAAFILTVGYFLFIKKRASHEAPAPTTTTPATTKVATETAAKDSADKTLEAKKD